ncbi:hypothetical protein [Streptomyces sp. NPDC088725]|uniref:hypothetical protein n=1 Tax=Streptomyces sp. NPDC088725 TaxID=3365873 RepID=UPI0037FC9429
MNDDNVTTPQESPEPREAPGGPRTPDTAAPAGHPLGRRLAGTVLPAVLVLGALGGGAVYIGTTVGGADKAAPTQVWQSPDPKHEQSADPAGKADKGRTDSDLSKKLLPVPEDFRLGPDVSEFGNDAQLSGQQATALMKASGKGFTGELREEMDKAVDKLGIDGIVARSYLADTDELLVKTSLVRMADDKAARSWYATSSRALSVIGRKGPSVAGHTNATCFLAPEDGESELDGMICLAHEGDLFIQVTADGPKPFDRSAAVGLVADQLDHIASPGKYI